MRRSSIYLAIAALILDSIAVFFSFVIAYNIRGDGTQLYYWPFATYARFALYCLPIWVFFFALEGLYNVRDLPRGWLSLSKIITGLLAGWGAFLIVLYLWHTPQAQAFPRLVLLYGMLLTAILCALSKVILTIIFNWLDTHGYSPIRSVIISEAEDEFYYKLHDHRGTGRSVVARFAAQGATSKLIEFAKTNGFDEIIVNDPQIAESELIALVNYADEGNYSFSLVPSLLSVRSINVTVGTLGGKPIMHFIQTPLYGWKRVYKRIFDVIFSGLFLVALSPIYLLLAILTKLSSRGPILFSQVRIGQDGKQFYVHKFRSMYVDADERFRQFGGWSGDEKTDPRITPLGRILRKTNLDELPQMWDVFRGAMSIVGPRPEQPKYVEKFSQEIPNYIFRHKIRTGLTGWAQVNGLRGDTSIADRVKYDLYYIENWSIWFDIRIILATGVLVLRELTGKNGK